MNQDKETVFKPGDVLVAKDEFLDAHETLRDTLGIVLNYNPDNDYLELGDIHPEKYVIPPIFCARGECYRLITAEEKQEWNLL